MLSKHITWCPLHQYYRFLNSPKTNWLRFATLLSKAVPDVVEPLTADGRVNAFVVDDNLFERTSCRKSELGSRVFDYISMKYKKRDTAS